MAARTSELDQAILERVAAGLDPRDIAAELDVSQNAVSRARMRVAVSRANSPQQIRAAVARVADLKNNREKVWHLHTEEGLQIDEIAQALGICISTVRHHLGATRRRLRLEQQTNEGGECQQTGLRSSST